MTILRIVLLILHFVGLASLLGGFLFQMSARVKKVLPGMFHGALTQLVTGLGLVAVAEVRASQIADFEVDHAKIAVKLVIALAITVLVLLGRRKEAISVPMWVTIGGLTLLNVVVAVAWR